MGAFVGLMLGIGLLLVWQGFTARPRRPRSHVRLDRLREELAQAGLPGITPHQLLALQFLAALLVALIGLVLTRSVSVSLIFAAFAAAVPRLLVSRLRHKRHAALRPLWPAVLHTLPPPPPLLPSRPGARLSRATVAPAGTDRGAAGGGWRRSEVWGVGAPAATRRADEMLARALGPPAAGDRARPTRRHAGLGESRGDR